MKTIAKILSMVMAICLVACCFTGCGSNYTADNTEFVIGVSGPLTGGAAVYGVAVQNSAQMAVETLQDEMFLGEKDFNEAKHGNCSSYGKVITMAETTNIFVA